MDNMIKLPSSLTAENGAKRLLNGEFEEIFDYTCGQCLGVGIDENEGGNVGELPCEGCDGEGFHRYKIPVSWTTIKDIYKMIVENLKEPNDTKRIRIIKK
jgi:excinuclease UvrABC ATPase subunit